MNRTAENKVHSAATQSSGPRANAPRPSQADRPRRVVGLLAAVGFSLAMWAFIALAVLGVVLKILG